MMRHLSVCSGIEAATVAWHPLGWQAAAFSDIEAFPRALLKHHYPEVPLHGDFTTIEGNEYGTIDLLVGGTPCQSFSVAGKRLGLDDPRGNLAIEFLRLAVRLGVRWFLWENVPGVTSSWSDDEEGGTKGDREGEWRDLPQTNDFDTFLGFVQQCGYSACWRILDAQYFGVPQRRRRVFVVGYLGDWRPPAAVLFEREGLCGDITPGRKARQSIAGTFKSGSGSGSWNNSADYAAAGYMIPATHTLRGDGFDASEDGTGRGTPLVAGTVSSKWAKGTGGPAGDECQNLIADPIAYNVTFCGANGRRKDRPDGGLYVSRAESAKTLTSGGERSTYIAFSAKDHGADAGDPASTLSAAFVPGVASFKPGRSAQAHGIGYEEELAPSLEAGGGGNNKPAIMQHMAVRRLTPRECERLQGFPDDYTLIPYRKVSKKKLDDDFLKYALRGNPKNYTREDIERLASDGPRYKALGNSMAVPVMRWVGQRINQIELCKQKESCDNLN